MRGSQNLPASYANRLPNDQTHTGSTSFTPGSISLTAPLIFEGLISDLNDDNNKRQFGEDLISYYANSNIANQNSYQQIVNTPSGAEITYINTLIQTDTGGLPGSDISVNVSPVVDSCPIVTDIFSTSGAFAALKSNGSVVTW